MSDTFKLEGPKADRFPRRVERDEQGNSNLLLLWSRELEAEAAADLAEEEAMGLLMEEAMDDYLFEEMVREDREAYERGICPVCGDVDTWCPLGGAS
jgi:hypothetical protein